MGLVRTALTFGAGYVLGRPEGQAKVTELAKRPEVAQLRQQAASTVSSGLKTGKEQVAKATGKVSEKASAKTNGSGMTTGTGGWRDRRLPSFPRRGARHAAPAVSATAPLGTTPLETTATTGGTSRPVSSGTVSVGTTPSGTTPAGTASSKPDVPVVPPPPLPPTSPAN
jgi:hypothetical protein